MQLSEGKVTVRVGGAYIPLLQWTKELTAVGEKGRIFDCFGRSH